MIQTISNGQIANIYHTDIPLYSVVNKLWLNDLFIHIVASFKLETV